MSLLSLPREIRDQIFSSALVSDSGLMLHREQNGDLSLWSMKAFLDPNARLCRTLLSGHQTYGIRCSNSLPGLLFACRRFLEQSLPILLEVNIINVVDTEYLHLLRTAFMKHNALQHLRVHSLAIWNTADSWTIRRMVRICPHLRELSLTIVPKEPTSAYYLHYKTNKQVLPLWSWSDKDWGYIVGLARLELLRLMIVASPEPKRITQRHVTQHGFITPATTTNPRAWMPWLEIHKRVLERRLKIAGRGQVEARVDLVDDNMMRCLLVDRQWIIFKGPDDYSEIDRFVMSLAGEEFGF